jgi:hypothetical protein
MFSVNKLIFAPTSSSTASSTSLTSLNAKPPDELDPLVILQGLETLYITLKQQNNYQAGEQISSDKKLKGMQLKWGQEVKGWTKKADPGKFSIIHPQLQPQE